MNDLKFKEKLEAQTKNPKELMTTYAQDLTSRKIEISKAYTNKINNSEVGNLSDIYSLENKYNSTNAAIDTAIKLYTDYLETDKTPSKDRIEAIYATPMRRITTLNTALETADLKSEVDSSKKETAPKAAPKTADIAKPKVESEAKTEPDIPKKVKETETPSKSKDYPIYFERRVKNNKGLIQIVAPEFNYIEFKALSTPQKIQKIKAIQTEINKYFNDKRLVVDGLFGKQTEKELNSITNPDKQIVTDELLESQNPEQQTMNDLDHLDLVKALDSLETQRDALVEKLYDQYHNSETPNKYAEYQKGKKQVDQLEGQILSIKSQLENFK